MVFLFTEFFVYSFIGFIIETLFALATRRVLELRKTMRFLPLCPVYGLGATAMRLALGEMALNAPIAFVIGAIVGTAVELLFALFFERVYNVRLWNYSQLPFSYRGHISLPFSLAWGALGVVFLLYIEPMMSQLIANFPYHISILLAVLFLLDLPHTLRMLKSIGKGSYIRGYNCPVIEAISK